LPGGSDFCHANVHTRLLQTSGIGAGRILHPLIGVMDLWCMIGQGAIQGPQRQGRVWINREQCFEGVPLEVWNFHIGGYQVYQKWLKDRKGRTLEYEDIRHYQQIIAILTEIIRIMDEIDSTIIDYGGWPIG